MDEQGVVWRTHGLRMAKHTITAAWDHASGEGPEIEVFARVISLDDGRQRPYLLYLQGGPGQESPRPTLKPAGPSWLARALQDYDVVMLDQRGTGLSTPYGGRVGPDDAHYLTRFRADAIVADAEILREHLEVETWSLLGQSFGGFTSLHYLSRHPERLSEVLITGGLPPVGAGPDVVYAATYDRQRTLTARLYDRFPGDRDRMAAAMAAADRGEVRLPDGTAATSRGLRSAGYQLGMDGGDLAVHYLLERDPTSPAFGADLAGLMPFHGRNPLYSVIHESSYSDGFATRWSAQRTMPDDEPVDLLTGEHVFPWHFEEYPDLAPYREIAAALAEYEWPRLYDADVLRTVEVPVAAAIYADDPYVDRVLSERSAALLPNARTWVTDQHLHNGLRVSGDMVLGTLIDLVRARR